MRVFTLRLDEDLYHKVQQQANQKGIKPSRYLRSLVEKGLVAERLLATDHTSPSVAQLPLSCQERLAELAIENTVLTRELLKLVAQTQAEHQALIGDAAKRARSYLHKLLQPVEVID